MKTSIGLNTSIDEKSVENDDDKKIKPECALY